MRRFVSVLLLIASILVLSGCSKANDYGLSYSGDGSDTVEYIYVFGEERIVYVVGGVMTVEINGESKLLELALNDGDLTMESILESVAEDAEDEDIETISYPDGSIDYKYGSFTISVLNTHSAVRDVYFVPSNMGYYDVVNK